MISISTLFLASLVFNAATVLGAPVRITPGSASDAVPRAVTVVDTPVARANIVEVPVQRRSNLGRLTRRSARLNTRQEEEDINLPRGFVDVTPEPQQQKRHHPNEQNEAEVHRRFPRRVYAEYYGKREPATKIKETTIVIEKTTVHDTPYDAMAANMHKAVTHVSNVHNVNNVHTTNNHHIVQPPVHQVASSHQAGGLPPDILGMVLSGQMGTVMSMSTTTTIMNDQPGATPPPMMGMGMGMGGMFADKNGMVMSTTAAADPAAATVDPNAAAAAATSTDTAAAAAATPDAAAAAGADPLAAAAAPPAAAADPLADADDAADTSDDAAAAAAAATPTESAAASTDTAAAAAATPDPAAAAAAAVTPDAAAATPATGAEAAAATTTAAAAAAPSVDPLAPAATPAAAAAAAPAAESAAPAAAPVTPPAAGTDPSLAPAAPAVAPPAAEVAAPPVTPLPAGTPPSVTARSNTAIKGVIISREPVLENGPEVRSAKPSTEPISKRSISYSGASWASAVRRGFK